MKRVKWRGMTLLISPCTVEPDTNTWLEVRMVTSEQRRRFSNLVWGSTCRRRRITINGRNTDYWDCWTRFSNNSELAIHLSKKGIL